MTSQETKICSEERIRYDLETLGNIGRNGNGVLSRPILTPEDFEARKLVCDLMKEAGLQVSVDRAGNIIGKREGRDMSLPSVALGSHIDTVPNAGIFDGCVGVIGAIEIVRILERRGVETIRPIEVLVFNNEEGVRYAPLLGSKSMAGLVSSEDLLRTTDNNEILFRKALEAGGYRLADLQQPNRTGMIDYFLELHIEQGPVLEAGRYDVGIVYAINGVIQFFVRFEGKARHAGSTPMSMRNDALLTAAKAIVEVNSLTKLFGKNAVGTVGQIHTSPDVINVISDITEIGIDIRDFDDSRLNERMRMLMERLAQICAENEVMITAKERLKMPPVKMSNLVSSRLERHAVKKGLRFAHLNSGAYHDTMPMTAICNCGMLFVPSRNGISHSSKEFTDWQQIARGADVLLETVIELANNS